MSPKRPIGKKATKIVTLVDYGSGKIPLRAIGLAGAHPKKKFVAVDPRLVTETIHNLKVVGATAIEDLQGRSNSSVKIINTDYSFSNIIFPEIFKGSYGPGFKLNDMKLTIEIIKREPKGLIPIALLREIQRVLVPNGKFYITTKPELAGFYLKELKKFFGEKNVYARSPKPHELKTVCAMGRLIEGMPQTRIVCANRKGAEK